MGKHQEYRNVRSVAGQAPLFTLGFINQTEILQRAIAFEALYREVTAKRELDRSFEDMTNEIRHLIDQMDDDERRADRRGWGVADVDRQWRGRTDAGSRRTRHHSDRRRALRVCADGCRT